MCIISKDWQSALFTATPDSRHNSLAMLKKFFDRKLWLILFACSTVLMLVFLASGLGALHFNPVARLPRDRNPPPCMSRLADRR